MKTLTAGHLCGGYHSHRNHSSFSSVQRLIHCYPGRFTALYFYLFTLFFGLVLIDFDFIGIWIKKNCWIEN